MSGEINYKSVCYRLWNSCSPNKREHPSSPSFKDSPGKKRLRHVRVSVMKGTLQREPLPFHGSAENTSTLWSARAVSPEEHVSSQLPERNTRVHNRITCPPPFFFFSFCSWHSQLFTAQTEFDSCIPLSFQTTLHRRHRSSGLFFFSLLLLAYSHKSTDTGLQDMWRVLRCRYNLVAEHFYQFRAATGLQMTKSTANLLLGNSKNKNKNRKNLSPIPCSWTLIIYTTLLLHFPILKYSSEPLLRAQMATHGK